MTTRIWTKKQTQQTIRDLRTAGYDVQKKRDGYICNLGDLFIFQAMNGTNGYLVRYHEGLFSEEGVTTTA